MVLVFCGWFGIMISKVDGQKAILAWLWLSGGNVLMLDYTRYTFFANYVFNSTVLFPGRCPDGA